MSDIVHLEVRKALKAAIGPIAQVDAQQLLHAIVHGAMDLGPHAIDLGPFEIPGSKPTDAMVTRRFRIGEKTVRVIMWIEGE